MVATSNNKQIVRAPPIPYEIHREIHPSSGSGRPLRDVNGEHGTNDLPKYCGLWHQ